MKTGSWLAIFLILLSAATARADEVRYVEVDDPAAVLDLVPVPGEAALDPPPEGIHDRLMRFEVALARTGMVEFSASRQADFVRMSSKMFEWEDPVRADYRIDPDRLACFGSEGRIRCITLLGIRKAIFDHESLDDAEYQYTQQDYILEPSGEGSLEVSHVCHDGACYRVERD